MPSTILITGANRGIGLEFAKQYVEAGWDVIATCREPHQADALNKLKRNHNTGLTIHQLDVIADEAIIALAKELHSTKIDILLNNAGIFGNSSEHLGDIDSQTWQKVLRINTIAPLMMAQAFLPHVAKSQHKIIASISSIMGSISVTSEGGRYPYRSSKAGLNMVMKTLAPDVVDLGVISIALSPGWVQTDMGGSDAPLTPFDSVSGMRRVLAEVSLQDSGRFLNYDGTELAW